MSIRTRLTLAIALVLVSTLVVLGIVLVRSTRAALIEQVDDKATAYAMRAKEGYRPGFGGPNGRGPGGGWGFGGPDGDEPTISAEPFLFERPLGHYVFNADGSEHRSPEPSGLADDPDSPPRLPAIPSAAIDDLIADERIVTVPSEDGSLSYRVLVQRSSGGQIAVTAAPLTAVEDAIAGLVRALLVLGTAALAAAAIACWWLIRRGLRPVDRMVDTAAAIAAGDLSRRVPDADPRTELGRLAGALNEMLHQVERAAQARAATEERLRRFVADAAHELRTPLTSLRGYAELYRQGALTDTNAVTNAMGRIEAEGSRMARLVDDLLMLARLDQHRGLDSKPIDIVGLVREAIADFGAVAPDRTVDLTGEHEAIIEGDRIRLRQVIDNLLANARTHTPAGTPVHASITRQGPDVVLAIADEGPGIAGSDHTKVFERFWRADPARVRSRGGTGLGLAIVASLVGAHGGSVGVTSQPGQGATFTVRLPLARPATGVARLPTSSARAAPRSAPPVRPVVGDS